MRPSTERLARPGARARHARSVAVYRARLDLVRRHRAERQVKVGDGGGEHDERADAEWAHRERGRTQQRHVVEYRLELED